VYHITDVAALAKLLPEAIVKADTVKVEGDRLVVYADQGTVDAVRRFVALLDTPRPEVRLQVWTLQISGKLTKSTKGNPVQGKLDQILCRVEASRNSMIVLRDEMLSSLFEELAIAWSPQTALAANWGTTSAPQTPSADGQQPPEQGLRAQLMPPRDWEEGLGFAPAIVSPELLQVRGWPGLEGPRSDSGPDVRSRTARLRERVALALLMADAQVTVLAGELAAQEALSALTAEARAQLTQDRDLAAAGRTALGDIVARLESAPPTENTIGDREQQYGTVLSTGLPSRGADEAETLGYLRRQVLALDSLARSDGLWGPKPDAKRVAVSSHVACLAAQTLYWRARAGVFDPAVDQDSPNSRPRNAAFQAECDRASRVAQEAHNRLGILSGWPLSTPLGGVAILMLLPPEEALARFDDALKRAAEKLAKTGTLPEDCTLRKRLADKGPFPRFRAFLEERKVASHRGLPFEEFLRQANTARETPGSFPVSQYARSQAASDDLLREALDALDADMGDLFTSPLVGELQDLTEPGKDRPKVSLLGRSTVVVTSRSQAQLGAKTSGTFETTRTTPFTATDLSNVVGETGLAAGTIGLFPGLDVWPALAAVAGFLGEDKPVYTTVAPGLEMTATPVVLADLNSVRLNLTFKVNTERTVGEGSGEAPGMVQSHSVSTDPTGMMFDLLAVSTMNIQQTYPTRGWYVPVLHRAPILGPMFEGPKRNRTLDHVSLILITQSIQPRAIDFTRGPYFTGLGAVPRG
jgi:hypothetical protein